MIEIELSHNQLKSVLNFQNLSSIFEPRTQKRQLSAIVWLEDAHLKLFNTKAILWQNKKIRRN